MQSRKCSADRQFDPMPISSLRLSDRRQPWRSLECRQIPQTCQDFRRGRVVSKDDVKRAGWHTTPELRMPANVTPIWLPSRSPELNPVENV
jgi:hypothetical protein